MGTKRAFLIATVSLLCLAMPVVAHHRLEVQFDPNQIVMLNGTVTNITWANPHVHLYITAGGKDPMNWELEMGSPNQLMLHGWKIDTLRRGDHVLVNAYRARDGSTLGYAQTVTKTVH